MVSLAKAFLEVFLIKEKAAKLFCTEESLCRVLHYAALMDDFRARNPHMGITGNLQWDDGSAKRIQEEREIVFGQAPGRIPHQLTPALKKSDFNPREHSKLRYCVSAHIMLCLLTFA
jgi:hypothetical protein